MSVYILAKWIYYINLRKYYGFLCDILNWFFIYYLGKRKLKNV